MISYDIFDEEAEDSNHWMVVSKPGLVMMVLEVIGRKADQEWLEWRSACPQKRSRRKAIKPIHISLEIHDSANWMN